MTVVILPVNVLAIILCASSASMGFNSGRTLMGIVMSVLCILNMTCFILNIWRLFV